MSERMNGRAKVREAFTSVRKGLLWFPNFDYIGSGQARRDIGAALRWGLLSVAIGVPLGVVIFLVLAVFSPRM